MFSNNKFFAGELSTTNSINSHSSTTSTSFSSAAAAAAFPSTKQSPLINLKKNNTIVNSPPNEFSFDNFADKVNF